MRKVVYCASIARELDVDRATVRKYLAQADSKSPTPQTGSSPGFGPASLCEPWREAMERALAQDPSIQRIYQDLVAEWPTPASTAPHANK
jgi:transposase